MSLKKKLKQIAFDAVKIAELSDEKVIMFRLERMADHIDQVVDGLYEQIRDNNDHSQTTGN